MTVKSGSIGSDRFRGRSKHRPGLHGHVLVRGLWRAKITHPDGRIKVIEWENLIVDQALNDLLDVYLSGGAQTGTWYLLLKGAGSVAAADTPASHAGWSEVTAYDEVTRPVWSEAGVSNKQIDNSASPADFNINANGTVIAGGGLVSNSTKGGTTGRFYGVGDFPAQETVNAGGLLQLTAAFTMADAG